MNKKFVYSIIIIATLLIVGVIFFFFQPKTVVQSPQPTQAETKVFQPSETLKTHADPAGFSFNYPDNLSFTQKETDANTYADIQLTSGEVEGNITIRIADTKIASIEEWMKQKTEISSQKSTEIKLGNLKAHEIKNSDSIVLISIDKGIIFTIEATFSGNHEYWKKVYKGIHSTFSFAPPVSATSSSTSGGSTEEVFFESEEVVE